MRRLSPIPRPLPSSDLIDATSRERVFAELRLHRGGFHGDTGFVGSQLAFGLRRADMKINVEIDCTPLEARQFFGFPDVQPMQAAVMDKLQQQMMSNIDKVSPEALMQSWMTFDPKLAERLQDMFVTMAGLGSTRNGSKK